jgi:methionyl-tRNA synthetase
MSDAHEHWLSALVCETLRRPAGDLIADSTLTSLGITSIQAIALQYQIGEHTGLEMPLDTLLDEYTIADLAAVLAEMQPSWPGGAEGSGASMSQVAGDGE